MTIQSLLLRLIRTPDKETNFPARWCSYQLRFHCNRDTYYIITSIISATRLIIELIEELVRAETLNCNREESTPGHFLFLCRLLRSGPELNLLAWLVC